MAGSTLTKKLQMKPGQRAVIINAPQGYVDELGALPEGVELADKPEGTFDFVQLFVRNVEELNRLAPEAIGVAKRDGLLWISYPKQSSKIKTDINRDVAWAEMEKTGWRPVSQIAIDDIWSALRFRPADLVGKS